MSMGAESEPSEGESSPRGIAFAKQNSDFCPDLIANDDGTFTWHLRHGVEVQFDSAGKVRRLLGPTGEQVQYLRDGGKLVAKESSDGRKITIDTDPPRDLASRSKQHPRPECTNIMGMRLASMNISEDGTTREWQFGRDGQAKAVFEGEEAVVWTRSADRRIIQMAVGHVKSRADDERELSIEHVIGTN